MAFQMDRHHQEQRIQAARHQFEFEINKPLLNYIKENRDLLEDLGYLARRELIKAKVRNGS